MSRGPIPDKDPDRPKVPEIVEMAEAYVRKSGNVMGGSLHIVLDDENLEDGNLAFCIGWARGRDDEDGVALAEALLKMTKTQRRGVVRRMKWPRFGEHIDDREEEEARRDHGDVPLPPPVELDTYDPAEDRQREMERDEPKYGFLGDA